MNKNTLILLAVVGLLGVGAFIATDKEEAATPKAIAVPGYATDADLEKKAQQGIMDSPVQIDYPVDEVIYTFEGQTVRLVREGSGKDVTWLIKEPVEAVAVKYQVEKMVKKFETPTTSIQSKALKASDQVRFDLEAENRVAFTLKAGGNVWNGVDFVVGKVAKSEQPAGRQGRNAADDADTWVLKKGQEDTVYRIAGKDLRGPFEVKLSDLRDKKVFTAKADDLVSVTIVAPNTAETVELTGERKEQPKKIDPSGKKDATKDDSPPTFKVTWSLTRPAGVAGDKSIDAVARSLANLRTREFVAADKGPKKGLGKSVWKLTAKSHDGKTYALHIAATDGAGDDDTLVWAQVAGKDEFLKLDNYSAKNLRKGLSDLQDKSIFGAIKAEDITMLATTSSDGQSVRIEKKDGMWNFVEPAPDAKNKLPKQAEPDSVLRTIATARLTRFASTDEATVAEAALAKPEFKAQLTAKGKTWWLTMGPKMDAGDLKNQRWARAVDSPTPGAQPSTPFLIQDFTASRFRKSVQDLRRKTLFDIDAADVSAASIAWPDGKTKVSLEKNATGSLEAVGLPAGKKTKTSAVTTFTNTLARLRAKAFASDKSAAEVGLDKKSAYVIGATLADGKTIEVWVSTQTDGTDPYATTNFGPLAGQVLTLNKYQVDNLQKELKDFQE